MLDIIDILTLGISLAAFIYAWLSNTKKYELKYQHRCEIIKWYSDTNLILTQLLDSLGNTSTDKDTLMSSLSSQIEVARFYYPNIIEDGDNYGEEKPSAYRGYRNAILEVLIMFFELKKNNDNIKYKSHAKNLQRVFTSYVFDSLNVRKFNDEIYKVTGHRFDNKNIKDYLAIDPEEKTLYKYLKI